MFWYCYSVSCISLLTLLYMEYDIYVQCLISYIYNVQLVTLVKANRIGLQTNIHYVSL
jgi:hypothetical protein